MPKSQSRSRNLQLRRRRRKNPVQRVVSGVGSLLGAALAVGGGWVVYSNLALDRNVLLPNAIPAERKIFNSQAGGKLNYYFDRSGSGTPVVLVHSVNAAASAYEMRPLFEHIRGQHPVYALDLPGYGFSERSSRAYSPYLFEEAILDFVKSEVQEPANVIALSLGCEFAARAALSQPASFHSLVLISPTGLSARESIRSSQQAASSETSEKIYPLLSFPLWARPLFDLITTRLSIDYFLQQSFVGPVPAAMIDYAYATSHQPGAENVPLKFISGSLFTPNVRTEVYELVQTPTLVLYDQDAFTGFEMLPDLLVHNPRWQSRRIVPSMGLPQFERQAETTRLIDEFWQSPASEA